MKQIVTSVNDEELKQIKDYLRKNGIISTYWLLKRALFEYMERHPPRKK